MKETKTEVKAAYTKPRLTVHGNVEALTQTYVRCARHNVYNCCICSCPSS